MVWFRVPDVKLVRANGDKPHRCPRCHGIPDKAWNHGHARLLAIYECERCDVRWWRTWNDLTWRDHLWIWRSRTRQWLERRRW